MGHQILDEFLPDVLNFPLSIPGILFLIVIAIMWLLLSFAWRNKPRTRLRTILLSIFYFFIFYLVICILFFLMAVAGGGF